MAPQNLFVIFERPFDILERLQIAVICTNYITICNFSMLWGVLMSL